MADPAEARANEIAAPLDEGAETELRSQLEEPAQIELRSSIDAPAQIEPRATLDLRPVADDALAPLDPHAPRDARSQLLALVTGRRVTALVGAGLSTDSGIPDYRGAGRAPRTPIQHRQFVTSERARARYWARSFLGWPRIATAEPNAGHRALAALEAAGALAGVITQNVDGLHARAGSRRVVELHGALERARCLGCGELEARAALQERLRALNPGFACAAGALAPDGDAEPTARAPAPDGNADPAAGAPAPDGDADPAAGAPAPDGGADPAAGAPAPDGDAEPAAGTLAAFVAPACLRCGGVLKPDVVFFGDNVAPARLAEAWALFDEAEVLLVLGSSLAVWSGYRFVRRAAERGVPVAIVNLGPTRGDPLARVRVEEPLGALLPWLAAQLARPPV